MQNKAIIVLMTASDNTLETLRLLVPEIATALENIVIGDIVVIEG
jgi:hypothetical protein